MKLHHRSIRTTPWDVKISLKNKDLFYICEGMQRHQSTPALGGVDPGRAAPKKGQSTEAAPRIILHSKGQRPECEALQ